jgi:hypothetical protein
MNKQISVFWRAQEAEIRELFATNYSASQIAQILTVETGRDITRNMVCSQLNKLGLRRAPASPRRPRKPAQARSKPGLVPTPPSLPPEPAPLAVRPVRNGDQQWHHCRYGFGDPATEEFRFCGATRTKGYYCDTHWALCNVPVPQRKLA